MSLAPSRSYEKPRVRKTQKDISDLPDLVEEAYAALPIKTGGDGKVPHPIGIPKREAPKSRPRAINKEARPAPEDRKELVDEVTDPSEISGPRSIVPPPPSMDHAAEAHIQDIRQNLAKLTENHAQVQQRVAHLESTVAANTTRHGYTPLRGYSAFEEPPSRTSWLASAAQSIGSKLKGFWAKFGGSSVAETPKISPEVTTAWRTLEQVEPALRDIPTMFLTGKTMDGKELDRRDLVPQAKALNIRASTLLRDKKTNNLALEKRRSAIDQESVQAIETLVHSPGIDIELDELEPSQSASFLIATEAITKQIRSLAKTATDKAELSGKRTRAQKTLDELQKMTGGISTEQKVKRATLLCEAALRTSFTQVDSLTSHHLSTEYQQRLQSLQNILQLQGSAKEALLNLTNTPSDEADLDFLDSQAA